MKEHADDDKQTNSDDNNLEEALIESSTQSGSGTKRKNLDDDPDEHYITKIAHLVSQRLSATTTPSQTSARPIYSNWSNYDLSPPSTSVMGNVNTTPGISVKNL